MQSLEYSKNSEQKLPSFLKIALSYSDVIKGSFKLKKKTKKQKEIVTLLQKAIFKIWTACFSLAFSSVLNEVLQIQVQHCCPSCSRAVWALWVQERTAGSSAGSSRQALEPFANTTQYLEVRSLGIK